MTGVCVRDKSPKSSSWCVTSLCSKLCSSSRSWQVCVYVTSLPSPPLDVWQVSAPSCALHLALDCYFTKLTRFLLLWQVCVYVTSLPSPPLDVWQVSAPSCALHLALDRCVCTWQVSQVLLLMCDKSLLQAVLFISLLTGATLPNWQDSYFYDRCVCTWQVSQVLLLMRDKSPKSSSWCVTSLCSKLCSSSCSWQVCVYMTSLPSPPLDVWQVSAPSCALHLALDRCVCTWQVSQVLLLMCDKSLLQAVLFISLLTGVCVCDKSPKSSSWCVTSLCSKLCSSSRSWQVCVYVTSLPSPPLDVWQVSAPSCALHLALDRCVCMWQVSQVLLLMCDKSLLQAVLFISLLTGVCVRDKSPKSSSWCVTSLCSKLCSSSRSWQVCATLPNWQDPRSPVTAVISLEKPTTFWKHRGHIPVDMKTAAMSESTWRLHCMALDCAQPQLEPLRKTAAMSLEILTTTWKHRFKPLYSRDFCGPRGMKEWCPSIFT